MAAIPTATHHPVFSGQRRIALPLAKRETAYEMSGFLQGHG